MSSGAIVGVAVVVLLAVVAGLVLLAQALWKVAGALRTLADVVLNQAGIPTDEQRDEINEVLARLG